MDIQKLMREAEALQNSLNKTQNELGNVEVNGISGGGLVEIFMNARGELKNIKIKKEAVNPEDVETLEDLIVSAFRDANNKATAVSREKLGKLTGGMSLPGM